MNDGVVSKRVVGLSYEPGEGLPQVVVKGSGQAAEQILRRSQVLGGPPIVKDPALAQQLFRLPMDAQIGPELFELVAALLAHVYALDRQKEESR